MTTQTGRRAATLAQIVAIASGVKTRTEKAMTAAYHQIQKPAPFAGISRTYQPRDDEGEALPPESTQVQVRALDLLADVSDAFSRMVDVVFSQDMANCRAFADIVVDGQVVLEQVPVTHLMWLEKQVIHLRSLIGKLPVLDVAEEWRYSPDANAYMTAPTVTTRTKKVPRNHVKAPATDRHPAQVDVWMEDVVAGYWSTVRFSGAIPASQVFVMNARVDKLLDAIRIAREQANETEAVDYEAGRPLMHYLFGNVFVSPSTAAS